MAKKSLILLYNSINLPLFSKESTSVNLGLLAISSTLKKAGFKVILIPNINHPKTPKLLKKYLSKTVYVGVSCMTGDPITNAIKFSKHVKKLEPKVPILWGGFHPTIDYKNTIKEKYIDFIIRGQGEISAVELAKDLQQKNPKYNTIPGLVYKNKKKIIVNPTRPNSPISDFPFLDYDLHFDTYPQSKNQDFIYCSSRGCPFECTFCSVSNLYHRQYLKYPTSRLISDLETIVSKYRPKSIFFWDDNFFVDLKRVESFLNWYQKTRQTFTWRAFSRCPTFSNIDKKILVKLKKTNCQKILFGAESGSPKILADIKKHINPQDIIDSCKKLSPYKITPDYTFISGFPHETLEDLDKTIEIIRTIQGLNPHSDTRLFSFTPSPGIPILRECKQVGFKVPSKLHEWSKYEYHSYLGTWVTPQHQRLIKILVWITTFASESSVPNFSSPIYQMIVSFLKFDAKFRINHKFFSLPYEWLFIYNYYKRHYTSI